jgi:hypothetical protein
VLRRLLLGLLAAGLALTAAVAPAHAAPDPRAHRGQGEVRSTSWFAYWEYGGGNVGVWAYPTYWSIVICDRRANDAYGPGVQIDPEGAGPPDVLLYWDENGVNPPCYERNLGYPIRKLRFVEQRNGYMYYAGAWFDLIP